MQLLRAYLVAIFKNCFLFLKTKNIENVFRKVGDFFFCISRVLRGPLFREREKMFWLLFSLLREQLLSVFFFPIFCVSEDGSNDSAAEQQGALAIAMD